MCSIPELPWTGGSLLGNTQVQPQVQGSSYLEDNSRLMVERSLWLTGPAACLSSGQLGDAFLMVLAEWSPLFSSNYFSSTSFC